MTRTPETFRKIRGESNRSEKCALAGAPGEIPWVEPRISKRDYHAPSIFRRIAGGNNGSSIIGSASKEWMIVMYEKERKEARNEGELLIT